MGSPTIGLDGFLSGGMLILERGAWGGKEGSKEEEGLKLSQAGGMVRGPTGEAVRGMRVCSSEKVVL